MINHDLIGRLGPEEQILILALQQKEDRDTLERMMDAMSPETAERLVGCATRHEVLTLLCSRLKQMDLFLLLPERLRQRLDNTVYHYTGKVIRFSHECSQVVQLLQSHGIDVMLLKGAHLGELVYGNPVLRQMLDIDILVREPDLLKAADILLASGYTTDHPDMKEAVSEWMNHLHHLFHLHRERSPVQLEVHSSIYPPNSAVLLDIDVEGLWNRSKMVTLNGQTVRVLSVEDALLYVTVHLAYSHGFYSILKALADIRVLVDTAAIDWDLLYARASVWKAEKGFLLSLLLASWLLGLPLPASIAAAIERTGTERIAGEVALFLFSEHEQFQPHTRPLAYLGRFDGLTVKIRQIWYRTGYPVQWIISRFSRPYGVSATYLVYRRVRHLATVLKNDLRISIKGGGNRNGNRVSSSELGAYFRVNRWLNE